jgi:hypothetical protein
VINHGEWLRKRRKGCIKIHVTVNIKTKQGVSLEVSDERADERKKLKSLVGEAKRKARVKGVSGYGAVTPAATSSSWLLRDRGPQGAGGC